ncbi:Protein of unknown function [Bacillus wiedmannii]|uniref:Uncharacterized protein n=1 Tax=Bacillus wiedmannii TaxID=1890302 RepID=A0AB37YW76_9BACI|nr:Protein of unknown function [Bacillus wiedmannii]SCN01448.1 Protein of unknown function [Bacillus wiedmannii]SCN07430.1 Protein of unknown function [Bacillus wiedmannii]
MENNGLRTIHLM